MSEGRYFYTPGYGFLLELNTNPGLGFELCHFDEHASLHIMTPLGGAFLRLPQLFWREVPMGEIMSSWGFTWRFGKYDMGRDIHFHWGNKVKIIHMPWDSTFIRHDVLMADGTWRRVPKGKIIDPSDDSRPWNWKDKYEFQHPYTYVLKSGTIQERIATVNVEEREWRQKWLKWLPLFATVKRTIDVKFNDEVGERSGSWKGGCTGCGYDMKPGESPLDCLKRMELERKF